ncbi:MAG: cell envelope integrity protein TolA [Alsobacter sp.]
MKVNWSQPGMVVSGVAHAALLVLALVAFSDTKPFDDAQESVAVDVISASEFSQITKGEKTAREAKPEPKPRADKVADLAETKPPAPEPRRDVPTPPARPPEPEAVAVPPSPPERPKDAQAEADAKAKAEAEAKARAEADAKARTEAAAKAAAAAAAAKAAAEAREAEALRKAQEAKAEAEAKARQEAKAKAEADAKARAEAEAKAKADAEKKLAQEKAAEKAKQEAEAKKAQDKAEETKKLAALAAEQAKPKPAPAKPEAKFDPSQIEKLLTSKEAPSSAPSTAKEINRTASLGAPNASGPKLSPSQKDQLGSILKEQITTCWSPPPGLSKDIGKPRVRMALNVDGSLSAEPVLLNAGRDPAFNAMAESAVRAIKRCAPFRIPAQFAPFFSDWKELNVMFDPAEMLG